METFYFGDSAAKTLLIQMTDRQELSEMEAEASQIRQLTDRSFLLAAVKVDSWNRDLSPWPAPAVFGNEAFGGGAEKTLAHLLEDVLPSLAGEAEKAVYLGGYSLAGLFALWAGTRTDAFAGIAAASPSAWYPGLPAYIKEHPMQSRAVYLSLGDREEKTRHPVMSQVGSAIRQIEADLLENGTPCILEWNPGNHFRDPGLRTAKAFAWLLNRREDQRK